MSSVNIEVTLEVTPLGQVDVIWIIPTELIGNREDFSIEIPGYKYDLPTFASVPVPFSSKALELFPNNITFPSSLLECETKTGRYSDKCLSFKKINQNFSSPVFEIKYSIANIVNNDGIYFVIVYPFRSPFDGILHTIKINAKFSFNLRRYKFKERHASYPQNKELKIPSALVSNKQNDEISVYGTLSVTRNQTVDFHLTATRFPILIRRDRFWMTVFIIIILIALSPYLVKVLDYIFPNDSNPETKIFFF